MPTPSFLRTLALATALAGAVAAPAARAAEVDFTASAATQETIAPVAPGLCPANLAGVTLGSGTSSAMRSIAVAAADCIVPDATFTSFTFTNGRMVLTGATGEQLFLAYRGTLAPTQPGAPYALSGQYSVTGGTGRYWGAGGSGTMSGTLDMTTLRGQMNLQGRLRTVW